MNQDFFIHDAEMFDKSVETWEKKSLLCEFRLSEIASTKTNKIKKCAPVLMTKFS